MATPVFGVNTWLTLNNQSLNFSAGAKNLEAKATDRTPNNLRITRHAPNDLKIKIDGEELETAHYGYWTWWPKGFAGLYEITVATPQQLVFTTHIRVLPNLISYKEYEVMIQEIGNFSADLLIQLHSPAIEQATTHKIEQLQSPVRDYKLIESLMGDLEKSVRQIVSMPHQGLFNKQEHRQWHELYTFANNVMPVPGMVVSLPSYRERIPAIFPTEWIVEHQVNSYDVYENRLLKQFLWRQLLPRLDEIENRAGKEIERRKEQRSIIRSNDWEDTETKRIEELEQVIITCQKMQRQVIGWGNLPFLHYVSTLALRNVPTQILQKHPAYSRFYQIYLRFQEELKWGLNSEGFLTKIAMRKLSELYEIWSVFKLTHIILALLGKMGYEFVGNQGFFRLDDQMFHFEVERQASITLQKGNKRVLIRYQPIYPPDAKLPEGLVCARRYQRTPDLAVEVWQETVPPKVLIFDAKYRVEQLNRRDTFLDEDLQKMGSYLTEIRWKTRPYRSEQSRNLTQVVLGAYILYPGDVFEDQGEVGALPLVPGKQPKEILPTLKHLFHDAEII